MKSYKDYLTWKPTDDAQEHLLNCNFEDTEATAIADKAIAFVQGDRAPTVSQKNNTQFYRIFVTCGSLPIAVSNKLQLPGTGSLTTNIASKRGKIRYIFKGPLEAAQHAQLETIVRGRRNCQHTMGSP